MQSRTPEFECSKAERVASAIFDAINDNVATKADLVALRSDLRGDIARVEAAGSLTEHRLLTRLGGLVVVVAGLLFTALHYWPPR